LPPATIGSVAQELCALCALVHDLRLQLEHLSHRLALTEPAPSCEASLAVDGLLAKESAFIAAMDQVWISK